MGVRRAIKIDGIAPEAKHTAREAGLDNKKERFALRVDESVRGDPHVWDAKCIDRR